MYRRLFLVDGADVLRETFHNIGASLTAAPEATDMAERDLSQGIELIVIFRT